MHNNYYLIRQISRALVDRISGWRLIECFSQNKNELILIFENKGIEFIIKSSFNPDFSCLSFPENFSRSRKNNIDLFQELVGLHCQEIYQFENERSFYIKFSQHLKLLFKLHGNLSNLVLLRDDKPVALFKNNLKNDWQINPGELNRQFSIDYDHLAAANFQVRKIIPTFDKYVQNYLLEKDYPDLTSEEKWKLVQEVLNELYNPTNYYLVELDGNPAILLFQSGHLSKTYQDPLPAITDFYHQYTRAHYLKKEKNEVLNQLQHQKTKTGNYLVKVRDKLNLLEQESRHEEIANIIMANLHQIPRRAVEVELFDFYRNKPLKIKMKRDLSPQQNAEIYYRKAKNQKYEISNLKENLESKTFQLDRIENEIEQISEISDLKSLRAYLKETGIKKDKGQQEEQFPFWVFEIEGFKVWVGKNAANNDLLTQKYAHKEDLWLHAKDVTGSHVVIKHQSGRNFSQSVIEKAAQIAAFFSKRKHDTLCPVQHTLKKYVRKPKGSVPGLVVLDREEVILVEPQKP